MSISASPPAASSSEGERGFALVAAIWLAGLIAAIAAGFAISVRIHLLTQAVARHGLEAELAADGLTRLLAFHLAADPAAAFPRDGTPFACRWNERLTATAAVQDQAGLVDLNVAAPELLQRLITGLGAPAPRAEAIATAVADFRDADGDAQGGGFEPTAYPGFGFGPKNGPFLAVEELDQIPGLDEDLYRRLKPLVTANSLQFGLDPQAIPPALKAALAFDAKGAPPPELAGLIGPGPQSRFGIAVTMRSLNGVRYKRAAIVDLVRQPDRPFAVLAWQQGGDSDEDVPETDRPCF